MCRHALPQQHMEVRGQLWVLVRGLPPCFIYGLLFVAGFARVAGLGVSGEFCCLHLPSCQRNVGYGHIFKKEKITFYRLSVVVHVFSASI